MKKNKLKKSSHLLLVSVFLLFSTIVIPSALIDSKNISNDDLFTSVSYYADVEKRIDELLSQMTLEEKCEQLYGDLLEKGFPNMYSSADNERLGIPGFNFSDGPNGVAAWPIYNPATAFPVGPAQAATWDPQLIEELGTAMGREYRGWNQNQMLGPAVDIQRDPRNGRSAETMGEDSYLTGKIGASLIQGIQSEGVIATLKHFTGVNHQGNPDRHDANIIMDERTLIELYCQAFRLGIQEGGAMSVMNAYNWINGIPCSSNYELLTEILRNKFGYEYYVISDWMSTYDGTKACLEAGVDLEMPGLTYPFDIYDLVNNGEISMDTLDTAVRRVLRSKISIGLLDDLYTFGNTSDISSSQNIATALEVAQKSIILLKNEDDILPLDINKVKSIALIGPNADKQPTDGTSSSTVNPTYTITPLQGIHNRAPDITINFAHGCDINSNDTSGYDIALSAAQGSDVVVYVGGLDETQEGEGGFHPDYDRTGGSVQLPGMQQDLINKLAAINPNIIIVIESGGIVAVENCVDNVKGFLYTFYPGQEGGNAMADTLFGNINPGGKLPVTMPRNDDQLPEWDDLNFTGDIVDGFGYRRFDSLDMTPRYAFGYGLSYTTFDFSNLRYTRSARGNGEIVIKMDVKNTGTRLGDEVIQLYLTPKDASVEMPVKQLRGFKRITLKPGETQTVNFILGLDELSYWSEKYDCFFVEKGRYNFHIGSSSDNLTLSGCFKIRSNYKYLFDKDNETPRWVTLPRFIKICEGENFITKVEATDDYGIYYYTISETSNFAIDENGVITNIISLNIGIYWLRLKAHDPNGNCITGLIKIKVIPDHHRGKN